MLKKLFAVGALIVTATNVAVGDPVTVLSQYSFVGVSASLHHSTGLIVERSASDQSIDIADRSASVEVVADARGVTQTASASIMHQITRNEADTDITLGTALAATFSQASEADLQTGSAGINSRADFSLRFAVDRAQTLTFSISPTGGQSLAGMVNCHVSSETSGVAWSSALYYPAAGGQTGELVLEPGTYNLNFSASSTWYGSFSIPDGYAYPVAGDSGASLSLLFRSSGQPGATSGRLAVRKGTGGKLIFDLAELLPGRSYVIERAHLLADLQWVFDSGIFPVSDHATMTKTIDPAATAVIYRLRREP